MLSDFHARALTYKLVRGARVRLGHPVTRERLVLRVSVVQGVTANRLAIKAPAVDNDDDGCEVLPSDVTDHAMASARRGWSHVQLCSAQPVDAAWSLLAVYG